MEPTNSSYYFYKKHGPKNRLVNLWLNYFYFSLLVFVKEQNEKTVRMHSLAYLCPYLRRFKLAGNLGFGMSSHTCFRYDELYSSFWRLEKVVENRE